MTVVSELDDIRVHLVAAEQARLTALIATEFGLTKHYGWVAKFYGPTRGPRTVAEARQALMWLLRLQGLSYPQIGALVDRHHTTVMHAEQICEAAVRVGGGFGDRLRRVRRLAQT